MCRGEANSVYCFTNIYSNYIENTTYIQITHKYPFLIPLGTLSGLWQKEDLQWGAQETPGHIILELAVASKSRKLSLTWNCFGPGNVKITV